MFHDGVEQRQRRSHFTPECAAEKLIQVVMLGRASGRIFGVRRYRIDGNGGVRADGMRLDLHLLSYQSVGNASSPIDSKCFIQTAVDFSTLSYSLRSTGRAPPGTRTVTVQC